MSDTEQKYLRGDRVLCRQPWQSKIRIGIITDVFLAPVSGRVVYVINGEGFYAEDVSHDDTDFTVVPEPQSLRA